MGFTFGRVGNQPQLPSVTDEISGTRIKSPVAKMSSVGGFPSHRAVVFLAEGGRVATEKALKTLDRHPFN